MRDEVEEFLRRAAERRAQVEAQRAKAKAQLTPQQPAAPRPAARLVQQANPLASLQPLEAEVIDAEIADAGSRFEAVAARQAPGSFPVGGQAARLGEQVGLADDVMDAHLHQVFDHQVGRLAASSPMSQITPAAASRSSQDVASESHGSIVRMLKSPRSLRDAIVVSEILQRPEHLWE